MSGFIQIAIECILKSLRSPKAFQRQICSRDFFILSSTYLTGLSPSTGCIVSAFSSNSKGRSDRLNFHVFTGESKRGGVSGGGISVDRSGSKADKADKLLAETSESALTKSALSPSSAVAGSSKKSPEVRFVGTYS